jgi:hypothetical protein
VSPSKQTFTFPITDELKRLLQEMRRRDGVSEAEQIRRGLRLWFESKGFHFDADGHLEPEEARRLLGTESPRVKATQGSVRKKPRA